MPGPIEHLPCTESALGRVDPRWKLAAVLAAATAVVFLQNLLPAALALTAAAGLAFLGRLPLRWCLGRLGIVLLVLVPFLVLLPFAQHDAAATGPWHFSWDGVGAAAVMACKTLSLTLLVLVLLATAPLPTTLQAAQALRVPGLIVQLAAMSYRYIFVLAGELARLRVALRVRGYRNRASMHCYRTAGHVTGTLLVRGYEQAERVGQAMRCRGFDGRFRTLTEFHTRPADVAAFVLVVGVAVGLVLLDWQA